MAAYGGAACAAVLAVGLVTSCADRAASVGGREPAATSPSAAGAGPEPQPIKTAGIPKSQRHPFIPTSLQLPSGTQVPVDSAGVDDSGVLAVPEDVHRAGWWSGGSRPDDPFGGAVIAGHVDSARAGIGVMAELVDVQMGARVVLAGSGGRRTYRIVSRKQVPKARLSADLGVFDQTVSERLILITCGGKFDPVAHHYADNLVVTAIPVEMS